MQSSRKDGLDMQPGWERQQMGTDLGKKISWEAASWNAGETEVQIMEKIRIVRAGGFETLGFTGRQCNVRFVWKWNKKGKEMLKATEGFAPLIRNTGQIM